jgi:hypothetical protein
MLYGEPYPGFNAKRNETKNNCPGLLGLSDETKIRGPLYLSVYARASKISHIGGQDCSGPHIFGKNQTGLRRGVMI